MDLNCEESDNYPLYDPENPEHNTAYQPPIPQSRSWSPLKEQIQKGRVSLRAKSQSPTRMLKSSRKALNELANSVKATAVSMRPTTPPALLQGMSPVGRDSEKSVKSKKSVHWRSSESTTKARESDDRTSPKDIIKDSSPILPGFDYSDHFLGSKIALTARPPPTPILSALEQVDQTHDSIDLPCQDLAGITQPPLLTPMPGTTLPLEDPFDDAAAVSECDFNIFEDPDCASEHESTLPQRNPDVEVLIGIAPSSIATMAVSEFLEQRPISHTSSNAHEADEDSQISQDSDVNSMATRIYPKPSNMRMLRLSSIDDKMIDNVSTDVTAELPSIEISTPNANRLPKGRLSVHQAISEVGSELSLGSALEDSDKENQCQEYGPPRAKTQNDMGSEHTRCGQDCRVPSLTEPVKHDIAPPNSSSRQPPAAQLITAKKLPPFHLQANVMSTSPPRDAAAFRFTNSSDESMSIVDETEYSLQARKDSWNAKDGRISTPSSAGLPLRETPFPGLP